MEDECKFFGVITFTKFAWLNLCKKNIEKLFKMFENTEEIQKKEEK